MWCNDGALTPQSLVEVTHVRPISSKQASAQKVSLVKYDAFTRFICGDHFPLSTKKKRVFSRHVGTLNNKSRSMVLSRFLSLGIHFVKKRHVFKAQVILLKSKND